MPAPIADTGRSSARGLLLAWAVAFSLCCAACAHCPEKGGVDGGRGTSDKGIEQQLSPEGEALQPDDVVAGVLPDADKPATRNVTGPAEEEEHTPATMTEAGEYAPSSVPDAGERQAPPSGADKPPVTSESVQVEPQASLGVDDLIERVKQTEAIGFYGKLAIRSEALDLIDMVKHYRQKAAGFTLSRVRAGFDGLLLKILALLDDDPGLARAIYQAKENLWQSLLEVKT